MKEKLFKWLFPKEYEKRDKTIISLEEIIKQDGREITKLRIQVEQLKRSQPKMADLMRDSLGLPTLDFSNVDKEGYPPHYLKGMTEKQRKSFIGELSAIHAKPEFQTVLNYWINMFGNHAIRNADKDPQPGRYGINGVAMIRKSFEEANKEFVDSMQPEDEEDLLGNL